MIYKNTFHKTFASGGGFKTSVYSGNSGIKIFETETYGSVDEADQDAKAWVDSISEPSVPDPIDFSGIKPILDTELSEEAKKYFKFLFPDKDYSQPPTVTVQMSISRAAEIGILEKVRDKLDSMDAHPQIEWAENLRGWNDATDELRSFLKTL